MVDVEALKAKLKEKQGEEHMEFQGQEEAPVASDPKKWGLYIIIGIIGALAILLIISLISIRGSAPKGPPQACFKGDVCVDLIVLRSAGEQEVGFSNYSSYPEGKGMLFIFPKADIQRMWMKDMVFPIDILWIDTAGKIRHIKKTAVPCRPQDTMCEIFEPGVPVNFVLELPSGFAIDNNLFDGDKVEFLNMK